MNRSILKQSWRLPAVQPVPPPPLLSTTSESYQRIILRCLQREVLLHNFHKKGQLSTSNKHVKRDNLPNEKHVRRAETTVMERATEKNVKRAGSAKRTKSARGTKDALERAVKSAT